MDLDLGESQACEICGLTSVRCGKKTVCEWVKNFEGERIKNSSLVEERIRQWKWKENWKIRKQKDKIWRVWGINR